MQEMPGISRHSKGVEKEETGMQKPQPIIDSTELLRRISRLSSEAEWTTEEVREALREGGVDPDQLVCRVLRQVKRWLQAKEEGDALPDPGGR